MCYYCTYARPPHQSVCTTTLQTVALQMPIDKWTRMAARSVIVIEILSIVSLDSQTAMSLFDGGLDSR